MATNVVHSNTTSVETNQRFKNCMPDSVDPLLAEFFVNRRSPLTPTVTEMATTDVDMIKQTKDSEENVLY